MDNYQNKKNDLCYSCGTVVSAGDLFCRKCGLKIEIIEEKEIDTAKERGNTFIYKNKPGITLFSIITFIMILFPPVEWGVRNIRTGQFIVRHSSFYFLIGYADAGREWRMGQGQINMLQLFLQIVLVLIISIFYQYYNVEIKKWIKSNF